MLDINFFEPGWIGVLFGIIAIILAVYNHVKRRSTAKPSFQKSSLRLLGRNENNLPREVTILFRGEEVYSKVVDE